MYDIIFITDTPYAVNAYRKFKKTYPLAKSAITYHEASKKVFTRAFWVVWSDLHINDDFKFEYDLPKWDEEYVHVFRNDNKHDGICLIPKAAKVSEREFINRFFINKKELDIDATTHVKQYDRFIVNTYEEYLHALENTTTEMFWVIPSEVVPVDDFKFDLYFSKDDPEVEYDRTINHVFKNKDKFEIKYNGIMLLSTNQKISKKEFDYRFLIEKKEYDIVASRIKPYDIIFISYQEPTADENWERLKTRFPRAKRIHGIKGIHQAHIEAAKLSTTPMFWVVDGDSRIVDEFNFELLLPDYEEDSVLVWRSKNPVNDLEYGYGGVKLLPTAMTLNIDVSSTDMTTSISSKFKVINEVSNITAFNTDSFNTWKSAFRECVKLASKTIQGQLDEETEDRLYIWCNVAHGDYAKDAICGARAGRTYGEKNADDVSALSLINDFEWLSNYYQQTR